MSCVRRSPGAATSSPNVVARSALSRRSSAQTSWTAASPNLGKPGPRSRCARRVGPPLWVRRAGTLILSPCSTGRPVTRSAPRAPRAPAVAYRIARDRRVDRRAPPGVRQHRAESGVSHRFGGTPAAAITRRPGTGLEGSTRPRRGPAWWWARSAVSRNFPNSAPVSRCSALRTVSWGWECPPGPERSAWARASLPPVVWWPDRRSPGFRRCPSREVEFRRCRLRRATEFRHCQEAPTAGFRCSPRPAALLGRPPGLQGAASAARPARAAPRHPAWCAAPSAAGCSRGCPWARPPRRLAAVAPRSRCPGRRGCRPPGRGWVQ